jgi:hypothetical protein
MARMESSKPTANPSSVSSKVKNSTRGGIEYQRSLGWDREGDINE